MAPDRSLALTLETRKMLPQTPRHGSTIDPLRYHGFIIDPPPWTHRGTMDPKWIIQGPITMHSDAPDVPIA